MFEQKETPIERIISALTYPTAGMVGILWQIFCVMTKRPMSKFVVFNIYQSVFLAIFLFLVFTISGMAYDLMIKIPLINVLANYFALLLNAPIIVGFSILQLILYVMYLYLIGLSLFGKYAYIPWVSNIILYQINRF